MVRLNLTSRQVALLGTMSDPDAARELGTTAYAIRAERRARGIAPFRAGGVREGAGRPPAAGVKQTERLGLTMTEPEMAEIIAAVPEGAKLGRWVVEAALMRARAQEVDSELAEALDRLHRCMVHDARDWSLAKRDALSYALVVGWSSAWDEVAARHGWSEADVAALKRLHAAIDRRKALHRDEPAAEIEDRIDDRIAAGHEVLDRVPDDPTTVRAVVGSLLADRDGAP